MLSFRRHEAAVFTDKGKKALKELWLTASMASHRASLGDYRLSSNSSERSHSPNFPGVALQDMSSFLRRLRCQKTHPPAVIWATALLPAHFKSFIQAMFSSHACFAKEDFAILGTLCYFELVKNWLSFGKHFSDVLKGRHAHLSSSLSHLSWLSSVVRR